MILDLHCHSRHSDGTDPPALVAHHAAMAGVQLLCLTDHDTVAGCAAVAAVWQGAALRGMELSCAHRGRTVHLLLYGLEGGAGAEALSEALANVRERRRLRIHEICDRLATKGVRLSATDVLAAAGDATAGRPHVARALVKAGICKTTAEAFTRFLADGKPADVPVASMDVGHGVELARAAGARVSLAHPHRLGPDISRALFQAHKAAGLEGVEALYGPAPARVRSDWCTFADDLSLVVTAGSDYHGPGVLPGADRPGVDVPADRAAPLLDWLGVDIPRG